MGPEWGVTSDMVWELWYGTDISDCPGSATVAQLFSDANGLPNVAGAGTWTTSCAPGGRAWTWPGAWFGTCEMGTAIIDGTATIGEPACPCCGETSIASGADNRATPLTPCGCGE